MRAIHRTLTPSNAIFATSMARRAVEDALQAARECETDARRDERRATLECRRCFYLRPGRIGGAAMTAWTCGVCGMEQMHGSTAVPRVCKVCAADHSLCRECGGDLEMRAGRRKWPEPSAVVTVRGDT